MALLLIIPSWLLVISLVVALCVAARRGDRDEDQRRGAPAVVEPSSSTLATRAQTPKRAAGGARPFQAGRTAA
jgi:hypothetical protein